MVNIITVPKIGSGVIDVVPPDGIRPDVPEGTSWQMIEERETEFVIEILN